MKYDIAIIGSGSVGSFAGYYAAKSGRSVCFLDIALPPHALGSYHGDTRIFRIAYGEGARYIPLLKRAYALWNEFENASGVRLFERCGVLNIGNPKSEFMQNVTQSSKEFMLDTTTYSANELQKEYGFYVPQDFIGIKENKTGFIYSDRAVESALRLGLEHGANLFVGKIERIEKDSGFYHIHTAYNEIKAAKILLSAGSFADEVLASFAFPIPHIPVKPKRKMLNWFHADSYKLESGMPAFIMEFGNDHFYGFPDFGAGVKIGLNVFGEDITKREELGNFGDRESDTKEIATHIRRYMPKLNGLTKGAVCTYAMTPDEGFIIDFIEDGLLYLGGLSHGFKFAPALAELGIQTLQQEQLTQEALHFSLNRFTNNA